MTLTTSSFPLTTSGAADLCKGSVVPEGSSLEARLTAMSWAELLNHLYGICEAYAVYGDAAALNEIKKVVR